MTYRGISRKMFDWINYTFLTLLLLITLYPFWDSLIVSVTPLEESMRSSIHLFPKEVTFEAYKHVFQQDQLWLSYRVSSIVVITGTLLSMVVTTIAAYALSKDQLPFGRSISFLIIFTMLFNGGLIPTYLVVKQLGLMNTMGAMIVPLAVQTYHLIIMISFFRSIPEGLEESAKIDGYNDFGILLRIVLPLSKPVLATIALFYAVNKWNEFFTAVMYITDPVKWPIQLFLRSMLISNDAASQTGAGDLFLMGDSVKMAAVMVTTIPIMLIYPFFQRFFVEGATLGGVKE